ncbi:MAG: M60 family metallopeptidase [Myxococcales bacterium]|nr:M60 family metallopeptidase [Myxococcales bacterium]
MLRWIWIAVVGCGKPAVPEVPTDEPTPPSSCGTEVPSDPQAAFDALTTGVDAAPVEVVLDDEGNGSLQLGLHADVLPVLFGPSGVHVAASTLGKGRVVAFSGQEFLSSGTRSTLLGQPEVDGLVRNAVAWAAGRSGGVSVLADNDAVASVIASGTDHEVEVPDVVQRLGLREIKDWSAARIADHDVLVVQINEWGTLKVDDADLPALRDFVAEGGGLLVAGAALHWSWWLADQGPAYPGDQLLQDVGITWALTSVDDMTEARLSFDAYSAPTELWCAYVEGEDLGSARLARLGPLFVDAHRQGRGAELQQALTRLVGDTPALPVSADRGAAVLAAHVGAHLHGVDWPAPHPWAATFPGAVADDAARTSLTVDVDTRFTQSRPLGAYAAPGDAVTVTLPAEHVGSGLSVRVGDLYDDLITIDGIDTWNRAPRLFGVHPADRATLTVGTGLGGALYLVVPHGFPADSVTVQLDGVVPMAVYTEGVSSAATFAAELDSGAPQAIVGRADGIQLVVAADAARAADPEAVTAFWGPFYDSHAALASEPTPRVHASHWLFDPQVGWGYANATSDRIDYPQLAMGWALRTQTGDEDWWLFGHEMGHQFQTADWTGGDVTEVCVNLWTMHTLNGVIFGGTDTQMLGHPDGPVDHAALEGSTWSDADLFGKLQLYRQLVDAFGWPTQQQVMASYYDEAYPRGTYGSFMDGYALRMSAITGRDLTDFLERWEYPMSAEARDRIRSWALPTWLPPGWQP